MLVNHSHVRKCESPFIKFNALSRKYNILIVHEIFWKVSLGHCLNSHFIICWCIFNYQFVPPVKSHKTPPLFLQNSLVLFKNFQHEMSTLELLCFKSDLHCYFTLSKPIKCMYWASRQISLEILSYSCKWSRKFPTNPKG